MSLVGSDVCTIGETETMTDLVRQFDEGVSVFIS